MKRQYASFAHTNYSAVHIFELSLKRFISSLLRKLGLRKPKSFLTIDICSVTNGTCCVIGWFFTEEVSSITLKDRNESQIDFSLQLIERRDVESHHRRSATGFQIICTPGIKIEDILVHLVLKNGKVVKEDLRLTNSRSLSNKSLGVIEEAEISSSLSDINAACEYIIVSENFLFVGGWIDEPNEIVDYTLNSSIPGSPHRLKNQLRVDRADVVRSLGKNVKLKCGFLLLFELNAAADANQAPLKLVIETAKKHYSLPILRSYKSTAESERMANLRRVLELWNPQDLSQLKKSDLFLPFVHEIYRIDASTDSKRVDFGLPNVNPKVSVIIPLYGRFDFMRYQLSHFSRYSEYEGIEILYVVDDPEIKYNTLELAETMHTLTGITFSLILLEQNMGFGTANNIAVEYATSDILALLNSDVLPQNGEWLDKLIETATKEEIGIVGARLIYENNLIQHDGMAPMKLAEYPDLYFNDHPGKGCALSSVDQLESISNCDLLTAACWVIRKEVFVQAGGFDPIYVLGDFEDSDLCFKVLALGKSNVIHRDVCLYHLERQSQNLVTPGNWKHNLTILNAITFNRRWQREVDTLYSEIVSK